MASLLYQTIEQISREKHIEPEVIVAAIEDAMVVAARKYYRTDNLTFVLLGNAAKIRDVAKKYGTVTEKKANLPGWAPSASQ